jgi:hypothetical protein
VHNKGTIKMLKHIGKHNDKRIVLVFRQIPGDEHMCLVLYSDMLPSMIHDEVMKVLESPVGQASKELSEALHRHVMADGRNCLEVIHKMGMMKKVPTNQVIITPNAKSSVRLDELNKILNEMSQGEEAVKRMADLDKNSGMTGKRESREVGMNPASRSNVAETTGAPIADILTDDQLATQRVAQAAKMKLEAQQLLAEAARLEAEAATLNPAPAVTNDGSTTKKKATRTKKQAA